MAEKPKSMIIATFMNGTKGQFPSEQDIIDLSKQLENAKRNGVDFRFDQGGATTYVNLTNLVTITFAPYQDPDAAIIPGRVPIIVPGK